MTSCIQSSWPVSALPEVINPLYSTKSKSVPSPSWSLLTQTHPYTSTAHADCFKHTHTITKKNSTRQQSLETMWYPGNQQPFLHVPDPSNSTNVSSPVSGSTGGSGSGGPGSREGSFVPASSSSHRSTVSRNEGFIGESEMYGFYEAGPSLVLREARFYPEQEITNLGAPSFAGRVQHPVEVNAPSTNFATRFSQQSQNTYVQPQGEGRDHSNYVAFSCSMVPYPSSEQNTSSLNVCIVDYAGDVLYEVIVDNGHADGVPRYRYDVNGHRWSVARGTPYNEVIQSIRSILEGKVIIGHSLWHDFKLLGIRHSTLHTRDHALFLPYQQTLQSTSNEMNLDTSSWNDGIPLPVLMRLFMRRRIGRDGYPLPVEDARASMDLFRALEDYWEGIVDGGSWPCTLPPREYSEYFL